MDSISNMLTQIRNANIMNHKIVFIKCAKILVALANILKEEKFIEDFKVHTEKKKEYLVLFLKYKRGLKRPSISEIKRISKPGLRVYSNSEKLPKNAYLGITILSTSKGLMTNRKAKELNIGGEKLCYVN